MTGWMRTMAATGLLGVVGCGGRSYTDERPPADSITCGDTFLQSKDVQSATDMMVNNLLSRPELNGSDRQWTIVLDRVENQTGDPGYDYAVFVARLRSKIAQLGGGRVALIANKAAFRDVQNRELEQSPDNFGQGGGGGNPAGVQPQYALSITVSSLENRATQYFVINATLTNLQTRVQVWTSPAYEVKTAR